MEFYDLNTNRLVIHWRNGKSSHHSPQVTANRRFARRLQFGAAGTWSKAMDYADTNVALVSSVVNPRVWDYGRASRVWRHPAVKALFDSWQISGVSTMQSGTPLGIGCAL